MVYASISVLKQQLLGVMAGEVGSLVLAGCTEGAVQQRTGIVDHKRRNVRLAAEQTLEALGGAVVVAIPSIHIVSSVHTD